MKTALITGIRGQDSAWLSKLLLSKDYKVIGTDRRSGGSDNWRLKELGIENHPNLIYEYMDITEPHNVDAIVKKYQPDELYQLAAQSFVKTSFDQPYVTNNVNYFGHLNILEAVKNYSFHTKIYFASTCLPAGTKIMIKKKYKRVRNGREHEIEQLSFVNIEDLKIGDEVLSMDMETSKKENCKILYTSNRVANDMYEVYFENGNCLKLSGNHPIYIINKGWVRTDELSIGDESIHKCCAYLNNVKRKGKTNIDIYGEDRAKEISKIASELQKNCNHPGNGLKGKTYKEVYTEDKIKSIQDKRNNTWSKTEHHSWNSGLTKENVFYEFLNKLIPNEFLKNGLAEHISIDGKIPDFVNLKKKKIIEYNGEHWHTFEESQERIKFFKDRGWETLIVWHSEFKKNPELYESKIKTYAFNPEIELSKIIKIIKANPERVYDIEVEKNHNFFANCILVHNSEMYGKVQQIPQNEKTPFYPRSPYGISKLSSFWIGVNYRESYGMFLSNGILFNHTSSLRGKEFVTQKIVKKLCEIKLGLQAGFLCYPLEIGNIYSERDFSHAEDMVYGMWLMLQQSIPDDYVLSSDKKITIKNFINLVCEKLSIDIEWHNENQGIEEYATTKGTDYVIIKINPEFYRPAEVDILLGDSSKARKELMWKPNYDLKKLIEEMIKAELGRN